MKFSLSPFDRPYHQFIESNLLTTALFWRAVQFFTNFTFKHIDFQ